jgi:hypothetical protein
MQAGKLLTSIRIVTDGSSKPGSRRTIPLPVTNQFNKPVPGITRLRALKKKPDIMPGLILKQLHYESQTWKRLLGFMMEENIHLKNRISEILKNGFDKNLLEEMENFQNKFIKEDELIGLLRNERAELDKLLVNVLVNGIPAERDIMKEINRRLEKFRSNIITAEKHFGKVKLEFNHYLSEHV